jgi:hypothetical protein
MPLAETIDDTPTDDEGAPRNEDAQAVQENNEPLCDACRECHSKRENVSAGVKRLEDIPELFTLAEIENFEGLTRNTQGKHIADLDDLLAFYDLPEVVVRCSLKGGHPHATGVVVKTLCELIICMGEDCGSESIIGYRAIRAKVNRRRKFRDDQRSLAGWATKFADRIAPLKGQMRLRQKWRDVLQAQLPTLDRELKRLRALGARGEEVTVKTSGAGSAMLPGELKGRVSADVRRLMGLTLLDRNHPMYDSRELSLGRFKELERSSPAVDATAARALAEVARKASNAATKVEAWLRETEAFATLDNLTLALVALAHDNPQVAIEVGGLRVSYMPGESGLFPVH